jgi:hypothetical protein
MERRNRKPPTLLAGIGIGAVLLVGISFCAMAIYLWFALSSWSF